MRHRLPDTKSRFQMTALPRGDSGEKRLQAVKSAQDLFQYADHYDGFLRIGMNMVLGCIMNEGYLPYAQEAVRLIHFERVREQMDTFPPGSREAGILVTAKRILAKALADTKEAESADKGSNDDSGEENQQ